MDVGVKDKILIKHFKLENMESKNNLITKFYLCHSLLSQTDACIGALTSLTLYDRYHSFAVSRKVIDITY